MSECEAMMSLPPGMLKTGSVVSVGEVCVDVDLLLDPGREVRHVAVHAGSEHFTEAHAAPRREAKQGPAAAVLLAHQRTAAVALNTQSRGSGTFDRLTINSWRLTSSRKVLPMNHFLWMSTVRYPPRGFHVNRDTGGNRGHHQECVRHN